MNDNPTVINLLPYPVRLPNAQILAATASKVELFKSVLPPNGANNEIIGLRIVRVNKTEVRLNGMPFPGYDSSIIYLASDEVAKVMNRQDVFTPAPNMAESGEDAIAIDCLLTYYDTGLILPDRQLTL